MNKLNKDNLKIPHHIAIIPDGNRRWAKNQGLPEFEGHKAGGNRIEEILKYARDLGVNTMTLWAFSTENWKRSDSEIDYLMKFFENIVDSHLKTALENNVKIYHLGRRDRLAPSLKEKIEDALEKTKNNTAYNLNIALDYGGHEEILRAVKRSFEDIQRRKITLEQLITPNGKYQGKYPDYLFTKYLDTQEQPYPYPDLIIRTSGEQRLSGFLPWQMAYSELYFTSKFMPEFTKEEFYKAIEAFNERERRFGGNSTK